MEAHITIVFSRNMKRAVAERIVQKLEDEELGVKIAKITFVENPTLCTMTVRQYLTEERWQTVHQDLVGFTRAYNCLANAQTDYKIETIGEILALGRDEFFKTRNLGRKTLRALEAVFDHDGLSF